MRNKKLIIVGSISMLFIFLILQMIFITNVTYSDTREQVTINFEDSNMAKAVYQYLGSEKCTGYTETTVTIYKDVLDSTTNLSLGKKKIVDISGVENFTNLQTLKLGGNSISDIKPIQNLTQLVELDLSENKVIEDISYLQSNIQLKKLHLRDNAISDLRGLSTLVNLTYLDISQNHVTILTPISGLGRINTLIANNNYINSIEDIITLTEMTELNLNHNNITSIKDISKLRELTTLNIGYNAGLTDLAPLVEMVKIKVLEDKETGEYEIFAEYDNTAKVWRYFEGYDPEEKYTEKTIFKLKNLTNLNIESNGLSSFSTIMVLDKLRKLEAQDNVITSIKGISKMLSLETLNLNNNRLSDITPIFDTEKDDFGNEYIKLQKLSSVSMANNYDKKENKYGIVDIYLEKKENKNGVEIKKNISFADFPDLKTLILNGNKIYNISTIAYKKFNAIDLSDQTIFASINYREADDEFQTVILPNIFSYSLQSATNVYSNSEFNYRTLYRNSSNVESGKEINEKVCGKTNEDGNITDRRIVFIDSYDLYMNTTKDGTKVATVEIVGGNADGSRIIYNSVKSGGMESILFKDANLYDAVCSEMLTKNNDHDVLDIGYISEYNLINIYDTNLKKVKNLDASKLDVEYVDGIKRLNSLTGLKIGQNKIKEIGEIALLKSLTSLSINNNSITSLENFIIKKRDVADERGARKIINETISKLDFASNITYLDASGNRNQESGYNGISNVAALRDCIKLTQLYLQNNNITDITNLETLNKLTVLNLGVNNISEIGAIKNLTLVSKLILANNNINDEQLENLTVLTDLSELDLSDNNLRDIGILNQIASLTSLTLSKNNIEDISLIKDLRKLSSLNLSGNNITNLNGIKALTGLSTLDLSNNKIEDVEILSRLINLSTLKLNFNKITKIDSLEQMKLGNLDNLELENQVITIELTEEQAKGEVELELPDIFKKAMIEENIVYSERGLATDRCQINNNIITVSNLFSDVASIRIRDGIAVDSKLLIAEALRGVIEYSTEELTNQDVIANITFNRVPVTITNNNGASTYTFTENGEFTFEFHDDYGFTGTATATVDWIDKEAPVLSVEYEKTEQENENLEVVPIVIATITSTETVQQVKGWELSSDGKVLTKIYTEDTTEEVTVYDLIGNPATITIVVDVEDEELEITSTTYSIEDTGYITNVTQKTNISNFLSKIDTNAESIVVKNNDGTIPLNTANVATGMTIEFDGEIVYTIIVTGDISGDGVIKASDLSILKLKIIGKEQLTGAYLKAADINNDGNIKASDLSILKTLLITK